MKGGARATKQKWSLGTLIQLISHSYFDVILKLMEIKVKIERTNDTYVRYPNLLSNVRINKCEKNERIDCGN